MCHLRSAYILGITGYTSKISGVLAPRLVGLDGKPLLKNGVIDEQAVDDYLSEEELLDGDEADMSILPQEVTFHLNTCISCDIASLL